jgi:hypothetical protein
MEEPRKIPSHEVRKNQEKARYMSPGYMMLLLAALCLTAFLLIGHVRLMAELTARTQAVTKLTVAVNDLKIQNDENYNQIVSGIDLGEIKRVAIGELGMVFPGEGQVVLYADVKRDYFRKLSGTGE